MGKTVQMIPVSSECSIFIVDMDTQSNMISFRSSRIPEQLKVVKIERIQDDMVYFDNYHCHISFIEKFLKEKAIAGE